MAAMFGPAVNQYGQSLGDLPLSTSPASDFNMGFFQDQSAITEAFAQARDRNAEGGAGSSRGGTPSGGVARSTMSPLTTNPYQSVAHNPASSRAQVPKNRSMSNDRVEAGSNSTGHSPGSAVGTTASLPTSHTILAGRSQRSTSSLGKTSLSKPPAQASATGSNNSPQDTARRLKLLMARLSASRKNFGRSTCFDKPNLMSLPRTEDDLDAEDLKSLREIEQSGVDFVPGHTRSVEELEKNIQASMLLGHHMESFVSALRLVSPLAMINTC